MNEAKRRGRPPKAKPEILALPVVEQAPNTVPHINGDTDVKWSSAADPATIPTEWVAPVVDDSLERAQAYAMRIWAGQSESLKTGERIARIVLALQGQNLPTEGIKYPGATDDDDWTDEDEKPVVWRKAGA